MAFFDNIKERAVDLANTGVAQSKRLAEITKLKTANMGEEDTIKRAYIELGKLYYAQMSTEAEGKFIAPCEKIATAKGVIEANNARISELNGKSDEDDFDQSDIVAEVEPIDVETVESEDEVTE